MLYLTFLVINGYELNAGVEAQVRVVLSVAAGTMKREEFTEWVGKHMVRRGGA
jgi:death-on-curing protein